MRLVFSLNLCILSGLMAGCGGAPACAVQPSYPDTTALSVLEVMGKAQCVPGRKAIIAPVELHPVVAVLAAPGDRVQKGQALVRLDDDEPKADVRSKEAALEAAQITRKEMKRVLTEMQDLLASGSTSEAAYHTLRTAAAKAEVDERAAQAAVDAAKAELEHFTLVAPIDGVVARLDVNLGTVSRPGTTVWGEILDLHEIDVRCDLTPEQAERVSLGQKADVLKEAGSAPSWTGEVVFVGVAAEEATGQVPVCVRIKDADGKLRCNIPVMVRFARPESAQDGKPNP